MRHNKRRGIISSWSRWRFLWILGLFIVVAAAGMILSQQLLLDNARTMGKNLVTSYSNDESSQLKEYDRILTMAMYYMEDMDRQGVTEAEFESWLADYLEKSSSLIDVHNTNSLNLYGVLNGRVISASGASNGKYDYQIQAWYQQAMEANGDVIFTNAYTSQANQGQQVVTIAVSAAGSSNAVAIDVHHSGSAVKCRLLRFGPPGQPAVLQRTL